MNSNMRLRAALSAAAVVLAFGTLFFHFVEGWSFLDAWFFTVVTVSTVGYGNLVPATAIGKIATTLMIFVGIGIFATLFTTIGESSVSRELRRQQLKRDRLQKHDYEAPEQDKPQSPRND